MSKHIFERLTLAQCVDVQCRPTVERFRQTAVAFRLSAYSAMCIAPWQSGAYTLKQSALYIINDEQ